MIKPIQYLLWLAPFLIIACNNATAPQPTIADTTAINDTGKKIADTVKNNHYSPPPTVPVTNNADKKTRQLQQIRSAPKPKNIKPDTLTPPIAVPPQKKSAVLGYSYFTHMKQEETRNIYAQVMSVNAGEMINHIAEKIQLDLKAANAQVSTERKSDTASYFSDENIFFFKYLTIVVYDPDNNFKIDSLGIASRQLIDTTDRNLWQWAITPKTSEKHARLILKVVAEKDNGDTKPIDTREIAIDIQLDTNFFRSVLTWLRENPEKLLVLVLIPLAAYFGKRIFDKKKS